MFAQEFRHEPKNIKQKLDTGSVEYALKISRKSRLYYNDILDQYSGAIMFKEIKILSCSL